MNDTPETPETGVPETPPPTKKTPVKVPKVKAAAATKEAKTPKAAKTPKTTGVAGLVIKLKDIILPEYWNRDKLTNIAVLTQSIKEVGLMTALSVRPSGSPDKYILVDGRRRYAALQEAKITEVNVNVLPDMTPTDAELAAIVANENREDNNPYERARVFEKLVSEGKKNRDLAKACGKTEGYVSQHRAILRTPDYVQVAICGGQLPPSATRILVKLNYEEDQAFYDKTAAAMIAGSLNLEDAAEKIDFYLAKKETLAENYGKGKKKSATKTKAEKRRGPAIKVTDYADKEVIKKMDPLAKKTAQEWLLYFADKLERTSSKTKVAYHQGILHGIEISYGLRSE